MNIELIFQIAGIGILTSIFHTVLKQAGKEEYS
ncbi:MAG: SpoIIIAC/SpoIIIAD family protein, partial [Bacillota bacterium]